MKLHASPKAALLLGTALEAAIAVVPAQNWNRRSPVNAPPPMTSAKAVYDTARSVVVLFGGVLNNNVNTLSDQTWEWDGIDWKSVTTPTKPMGRYGAYLAYDSMRKVTVLFGGSINGSTQTNDTWEYDGSKWTAITPPLSPSARAFGNMVYDWRTQRVVLLGGFGATMTNDTWEYDGAAQTWTQIPTTVNPDQSHQYAMTYDDIRGKTIACFGANTSFTLVNTLWEYDGLTKTWSKPTITGSVPRTRRLLSAAFVLHRQVMVVHGGDVLPGHLADTWEYDVLNATWTNVSLPGAGPGNDQQYGFAYDRRRESVVLWGGYTGATATTFTTTNWTWEYGPRGTFKSFGTGCPGASIGVPALTATSPGPVVGQSFDLQIAPVPTTAVLLLGLSNQRVGTSGPALPLDLTFVGAPGCALLVSPDLSFPLGATGGIASVRFPVPADPALSGFLYYHQALVRDATANALQHVLSNGGEARIL